MLCVNNKNLPTPVSSHNAFSSHEMAAKMMGKAAVNRQAEFCDWRRAPKSSETTIVIGRITETLACTLAHDSESAAARRRFGEERKKVRHGRWQEFSLGMQAIACEPFCWNPHYRGFSCGKDSEQGILTIESSDTLVFYAATPEQSQKVIEAEVLKTFR